MEGWLNYGLQFLSQNSIAVGLAALLILVGTISAYLLWYRPPAKRLEVALAGLSTALASSTDGWPAAKAQAGLVTKKHPALALAWRETEDRIIALPVGERQIHVMFGAPRDIWNAKHLLSQQMNLALAEAVPNLLVGLGLLFTFFFLTLALTQATSALVGLPAQGQSDLLQATRGLLSAAGAKFMTSLAGLLASIVWAIMARRQVATINRLSGAVLEHLSKLVATGGSEMATLAQLQVGRELNQIGNKHIDTTTDLLGLTQELLIESRERTGRLKHFETELAISLGNAISQAVSPKVDEMTSRLVESIEGLSDKIGTMNQEAMERMLTDFSSMLKQTTDDEMNQLRQTLEDLSGKLDNAGRTIGQSATAASQALDKAGADLLIRVESVTASLSTGAANLETAAQEVKVAMNDLDVTVSNAAELGRHGITAFQQVLGTADTAIGKLKEASDSLGDSASSLTKMSGQLANAVDTVEELSREQQAVVTAVKEATPTALAAIERVSGVLEKAGENTQTTMSQAKDAMEKTATSLSTTVDKITEGVTKYSEQVANLHRSMDSQMATAIGSLDKNISELQEVVEELSETMSSAATA